jgi:hypothetical protein
MAVIGMADAMLTELEGVESAEQLDEKLQGLFGPLLGGFMQPEAGEAVVQEPTSEGTDR